MSDDLMVIVGYQVESSAEWRRQKAEQFPQDRVRNLQAAEELDQLAKEIRALEGSDIHQRVRKITDRTGDVDSFKLNELVASEIRSIGFSHNHSGRGFLEWYCDLLEELVGQEKQRKLDEFNEEIADQAENDPAVKAAKAAYDEAYAKAYTEARNRAVISVLRLK
jgi:hypothetical protein